MNGNGWVLPHASGTETTLDRANFPGKALFRRLVLLPLQQPRLKTKILEKATILVPAIQAETQFRGRSRPSDALPSPGEVWCDAYKFTVDARHDYQPVEESLMLLPARPKPTAPATFSVPGRIPYCCPPP